MKMNEIPRFIHAKIKLLSDGSPWSRAMLAKLRRGIGKPPGSVPDIWEITIDGMPEDLLSKDGIPTREEIAIHTALTLYAMHQQGREKPMSVSGNGDDGAHIGNSFGSAVGKLVKPDKSNEQSIKRRFDAAVTSGDFIELATHARGLIQLLKAEEIPLDYPQFAKDLFFFQLPENADRVRLRWGQDFYRTRSYSDNKENNNKPKE
jgi:CRISPR system Cascade subunit CasB